MDDETRDQLTIGQTEAIKDEIKSQQPLIDTLKEVSDLLDQYKDAELPGFAKGIVYLNSKYRGLRKVRGDGNCFYRSFLYGYLDILVKLNESQVEESVNIAKSERDRVLDIVKNSMNDLVAVGYSEFTIETFHEVCALFHVKSYLLPYVQEFVELLTGLFDLTSESLLQLFLTENGSAEYYTWFMRLLTAGTVVGHILRPIITSIVMFRFHKEGCRSIHSLH